MERTYYGRGRKNYIRRDSRISRDYFRGPDIIIKRNNTCYFCRKPRHWTRECIWKKGTWKRITFQKNEEKNKNIKILI